ncbi:MAG: hypothetical protein V1914_03955 [archaeon]
MKKILSILAVLILAIVAIPAAMATTVTFDSEVKINGHEITTLDTLDVERGETLDLDLLVTASEDVEDLRWKIWIGGYEDLLEEKTGLFDLKAGVTKVKSLSIDIPADMDADETYTLHVELINGDVEEEVPLNIEISKARHLLVVDDVIVSQNTVEAGEDVVVKVRVENMGSYEEDVTVTVSAFGVSASDFIEDLAELDLDAASYDDYDNAKSVSMVLNVPEDTAAGKYDLVVELSYNRGRELVSETLTLTVAGEVAEQAAETSVEGVITVDATTKTLAQGEEKAYKLAFANLGDKAQLYTVRAVGTQLWGNVRVEPSLIAVPAGEVVEAYVYLNANEDAELGNHVFTLQVSAGNDLAKEIMLGAKVTEKVSTVSAGSLLQYSSTLKLAFVGLVVLLVIVGLFIAFRKLKEDEDYPLEPKDGQTYY